MGILFKKVQKFQNSGVIGGRLAPYAKVDVVSNWLLGQPMKDNYEMSQKIVNDNPGKSVFLADVAIDKKKGIGFIPVGANKKYQIGVSSTVPFSVADTLYKEGSHLIPFTSGKRQDLQLQFTPDKKAKVMSVLHMLKS